MNISEKYHRHKFENFDPIIHAPVRLAILNILIFVKYIDFTYLKKAIGTTDGNLGFHIKKLDDVGYVEVSKSYTYIGKKPKTTLSITESGRKAYEKYVNDIGPYLKL